MRTRPRPQVVHKTKTTLDSDSEGGVYSLRTSPRWTLCGKGVKVVPENTSPQGLPTQPLRTYEEECECERNGNNSVGVGQQQEQEQQNVARWRIA
eukprot:scaffold3291_cov109-Isochrysis_galbana.AAC.7